MRSTSFALSWEFLFEECYVKVGSIYFLFKWFEKDLLYTFYHRRFEDRQKFSNDNICIQDSKHSTLRPKYMI